MTKRLISIALAIMVCFALTIGAAAEDGAEHVEEGCCPYHADEVDFGEWEDGEQSRNPLCLIGHKWGNSHQTGSSNCNNNAHCKPCTINYFASICERCGVLGNATSKHAPGVSHNWFYIPGGIGRTCRLCGVMEL